ncbi:MAG: glycerol-3-phosphate 1-O-acyltransferase PlsY [Gemmatimonadaceae bacterium]|nr:glycerol-3-phosphate 1-O-acyltransferase PlsY [Gemmatimonadaceae bacterium]
MLPIVRDGLLAPWVGLVLAYLSGSIPFAYLAGRLKGIDLRTVGSGNLGATNVLRTLGWAWAAPVFLLDALKGFGPAFLLPYFVETQVADRWAIAYGAMAIAGHAKPIFLLWRGGGKGVATGAGVFLGLAPLAVLITTSIFAVTVWLTGYVSLGSLLAAAALPVAVIGTQGMGSIFVVPSFVIAAFVWWTHRANIGRLRRGEEHSFKQKRAASSAPEAPR